MEAFGTFLRSWRRRTIILLEAGFEVMARYPYDLTDLHWSPDLFEPPHDGDEDGDGGSHRPSHPSSGRGIKLMPPPASCRYQAARPTRTRSPRHKQPV